MIHIKLLLYTILSVELLLHTILFLIKLDQILWSDEFKFIRLCIGWNIIVSDMCWWVYSKSSFSQTHNIGNNSSSTMLPLVRIEPRTSDSKSNTPLFWANLTCATWGIFKFLFMHYLIFGPGIIIQVSSERRVLDLESEGLGSILTRGNFFLLECFVFT